jgi:hypothetical protein
VNNCPLDPEYPNRYADPNDPEKKCGYAKIRRIRISEQFPGILKFNGMTQREYNRKMAWDNMSDENKQKCIAKLKPFPKRSDVMHE